MDSNSYNKEIHNLTKRYIYHLKTGEWEIIFNNPNKLKQITREIFYPSYNPIEKKHDYFDWIKRITIMMINLSGLKIEDIFSNEERKKTEQWVVENCLSCLKQNDYHDTIQCIEYLNKISSIADKNSTETIIEFKRLLTPNNDSILTVFIIFIVEKIIKINFFGLHPSGRPAITLNPESEKFIKIMSQDKTKWLRIKNKVTAYFKKISAINTTNAFNEINTYPDITSYTL